MDIGYKLGNILVRVYDQWFSGYVDFSFIGFHQDWKWFHWIRTLVSLEEGWSFGIGIWIGLSE